MEAEIGGCRFEWGRRVYVMGIVNVTPDSFSGDGLMDPEAAISHGLRLVGDGADLLDVGGESTRPGHQAVTAGEELSRVLPVIRGLAGIAGVPVSVDTSKLEVAEAAAEAGATIVNDIWGLRRSPGIADVAARRAMGLVVMHNQSGHDYSGDLMAEISARLRESLQLALKAGIPKERVLIDPGIGFGKNAEQNLVVLRRLEELRQLGQPLLVGSSRKSFLGKLFGQEGDERVDGTAATVSAAVLRGAAVVRVHDVKQMTRVVRVAEALR